MNNEVDEEFAAWRRTHVVTIPWTDDHSVVACAFAAHWAVMVAEDMRDAVLKAMEKTDD